MALTSDIPSGGAGTPGAIILLRLDSSTGAPTGAEMGSFNAMSGPLRCPTRAVRGHVAMAMIIFLVYAFGGAGLAALARPRDSPATNKNDLAHRGKTPRGVPAIVLTISWASAAGASVPSKTKVRHSTAGISSAACCDATTTGMRPPLDRARDGLGHI